ncbi:hypothetical protein JHL18_15045 [Clostridium sp. YIM B02505]|uniref:Uncharacterized protein n=1 Tax=Clostridium yunnanense TaxID=2800325 RepID=A0ABS1ERB1_9CLOT|nr:hypothetical protein [Clostridium yunnanense]MBK1811936.1 hypothetical protein [Clostridium yunnanense]
MKIFKLNVESKSEMIEYLRKCNSNQLLLGENSEVVGGLYIFQVKSNEVVRLTVGVITEGHGLEPECKYVGDKLLIGFNKEVHIIDTSTNENKKICADSLFFEFASETNSNRIIAVFELEVMCFSLEGNTFWRCFTDVINEYFIENNNISIVTDSGKEKISLLTGEKK